MKNLYLIFAFYILLSALCWASMDMSEKRLSPDTVVMNDGTKIHGLIIKNDAQEVVLQERMGEQQIPKKYIRRIEDQGAAGVYFADIVDPGKIPPWRMVVQDLRADDNIHSFQEIPPTSIDKGYLKNIPYLSFQINKHTEMNVYGNPEDPVCLEFGVYEHGGKITQFKKIIRAYLAGTLNSRAEIKALYSLSEKGDERQAGKLMFKVLPPTAPDSYGGWWISVYEPNRLEKARVSDAEYKKVTIPFPVYDHASGKMIDDRNMNHQKLLMETMKNWTEALPDFRGFYRDKNGNLKLIGTTESSAPTP